MNDVAFCGIVQKTRNTSNGRASEINILRVHDMRREVLNVKVRSSSLGPLFIIYPTIIIPEVRASHSRSF